MVLIATKVFYYLTQNLTFIFLFTVLFDIKRKINPLRKMVQTILLTCVQAICGIFLNPTFLSIVIMASFCLITQIEHRCPTKSLVIETAFIYAVSEVLRVAYSVLSMFICLYAFGTNNKVLITALGMTLLLITCGCCYPLFRKLDLSELGEKYSVGLFALVLVLIFGALNWVQVSYDPVSREFFISMFFALIICFGILIFWAKEGKDKAHLHKELKKAKAINHELDGQIPVMERRLKKLVAEAKELKTAGTFATEAAKEYDMFTAVCEGLVGAAGHVDANTGIPVLDSIIEYTAGTAHDSGVGFECEIASELRPLLKQPGVTKTALQQLLRNLLDNAVHAAAKSKRNPRLVQCIMGLAGDSYRIDVYDSGEPFPSKILRNLGRMGNTTDGHGIGMVNVLEALVQCDASIFITHYKEPLGTGATKCVTVCFNGKAMAHLPAEGKDEEIAVSISSLLHKK